MLWAKHETVFQSLLCSVHWLKMNWFKFVLKWGCGVPGCSVLWSWIFFRFFCFNVILVMMFNLVGVKCWLVWLFVGLITCRQFPGFQMSLVTAVGCEAQGLVVTVL